MSAAPAPTAARAGLLVCHTCSQLARPGPVEQHAACPRCGSALHWRKSDSLRRSWALLIAAFLLYIPANLLPVMITSSTFGSQSDTIMSGIVYLWHSGSWPLAVIVFVASITVPLAKLIALTLLLMSVQMKSAWDPRQRTRLYRMVEAVGRWSMLDIYVATLLAALVQFQTLAIIRPGSGAIAFCGVVIITMFAAQAFDPRLIWDAAEKAEPAHG
ncbi:MAG: paraquat-inducible protein A [Burkholderiales bacterium]